MGYLETSLFRGRAEKVLHKPKVWAIVVVLALCSGVVISCAANPWPKLEDILGDYEFEGNIYTNPLSSYIAVKGFMPTFKFTESALLVIPEHGGPVEEYAALYETKHMKERDFAELFSMDLDMPDISRFKVRHQYGTFGAEGPREYRLYVMDGQVWLALFHGDYMWSIYKLVGVKGDRMGATNTNYNPGAETAAGA